MPKGNPRQGHVAIAAPDGRRTTPNHSRRARMLRTKQANSLNFSTVPSTSPTPASVMMPRGRFFMQFRGPKAHSNRLRNLGTPVRRVAYMRPLQPAAGRRSLSPELIQALVEA